MEYIIDNNEYYQRPQLWLNRTNLLTHWDDLDDLYRLHQEQLFTHPEIINHWVQDLLEHAWLAYPQQTHEVTSLF